MAGFLHRTLVARISCHSRVISACVATKYIFSMTENKSEEADWKKDLSSESESKDKTVLMLLMPLVLLMLDIKLLESLPEGMEGSMEVSCRYL